MINTQKMIILLIILMFFWSGSLLAATPVNVGGYIFPPFVEKSDDGKISGITIDMIEALNQIQNEYTFQFVFTSPIRRYKLFNDNYFDMLFFEDLSWGWQSQFVESTKVFLKGSEVFITLRENTKDENYFNTLDNKSIAGILGYHYKFANFNADPEFLKSNFNMSLSSDIDKNIRLVLKDRIDLAIVTKSYLEKYLLSNNSAKSKLFISKKIVQQYNHTILIRKGLIPDTAEMDILIDELICSGKFQKILNKYGITR